MTENSQIIEDNTDNTSNEEKDTKMKVENFHNNIQTFVTILVLIISAISGFFAGKATFQTEIGKLEKRLTKIEEADIKMRPFKNHFERSSLYKTITDLIVLEDEFTKLKLWADNWEKTNFEYTSDFSLVKQEALIPYNSYDKITDSAQIKETSYPYLNTRVLDNDILKQGYNIDLLTNMIFFNTHSTQSASDLNLVKDLFEVLKIAGSINEKAAEISVIPEIGISGRTAFRGAFGQTTVSEIPFGAQKKDVEEFLNFAEKRIIALRAKINDIPSRIEERREEIESLVEKLEAL